jgi:NAD(P)-dependent dehydrogenase (short-subunit alcohol dehydrogenase family)
MPLELEGKTFVVTGATDGIGKQTALELARQGATVFVHGRNQDKAHRVTEDIQRQTGNINIQAVLADFADLNSVRNLGNKLQELPALHGLINNAGAGNFDNALSKDGFELTFAVSHLAHFLLTLLLLGPLGRGSGRVVTVSSASHRSGKLQLDKLREASDANSAYSRAKLANLLFSYELARRLEHSSITSNAFDPGPTQTQMMQSLQENVGGAQKVLMKMFLPLVADKVENVAPALAWLVSAPELRGVTGKYYNKKQKQSTSSATSHDLSLANMLWELSEDVTDIKLNYFAESSRPYVR